MPTARRIRSGLNIRARFQALGFGVEGQIPPTETEAPANRPSDSVVATAPSSTSTTRARVRGPKPIYIYPGLLRVVRRTAIALDARCPAAVYQPEQHTSTQCCICLEDFRSSDLVRKIPCGHSFHSLCLLRWLQQHDRCPLCMDIVSSHPVKERVRINFPTAHTNHRRSTSASTPETASIPAQAPTRGCSHSCSCSNMTAPARGSSTVDTERTHSSNSQSASTTSTEPTEPKKKSPRTYSYIVHDPVRMQIEKSRNRNRG